MCIRDRCARRYGGGSRWPVRPVLPTAARATVLGAQGGCRTFERILSAPAEDTALRTQAWTAATGGPPNL
eukprot:4746412-Alexandrium_andersonii.AAC.1